jgi:acyl-coenzyme A thioesterase PaaI-like protein
MDSSAMSESHLAGRRRTAEVLRNLTREVITADLEDASFQSIADALDKLREELTAAPRLVRETETLHTPERVERVGRTAEFDRDPLIGLSNSLAPPMIRTDEEKDEWRVTFGDAFEGHPGFVHGGFVAAVLDHVLGVAASTGGVSSMTGTLTIRYRRPTPARKELLCRGEIDRVEGRKVFCHAELLDGDTLSAEAEGIFIRVEPDHHSAGK